jgi:tetratricopeptide (TPR) repeat protein
LILPLLLVLLGTGEPSDPRPVPAAVAPESGADLLREAKSYRYAQQWYQAIQTYRRYVEQYPQSGRVADARFWMAASMEQNHQWDDAANAYTAFLGLHPDQRLLGREARLNRIRCWGVRQWDSREAAAGLVEALGDDTVEVRVAAALQLARKGDRRAVDTLQQGLRLPACADACSLALVNLGVKPQPGAAEAPRFLVIRIHEAGGKNPVTIRLALALARAVGSYLSDAQLAQVRAKGLDPANLTEQALALPRGSVLFSVQDAKSTIQITVE